MDRLAISDEIMDVIGLGIVEEFVTRLSDYGDYLVTLSIEEELFTILASSPWPNSRCACIS